MRVEIDGQPVEVEPGTTILEAAQAAGRYVPTLCFDERFRKGAVWLFEDTFERPTILR